MEILDEKSSCLSIQYQTLNVIITTGQTKEYLGRSFNVKDLDAMSQDEIDAYYNIYEFNYANKIGESIVHSIIGVYAKAVNKILPIDDVKKVEIDLNSDNILTHELKTIMCPVSRTCEKLMSLFEQVKN